ncbi:MAG: putative colanic acid biosynthesis acetyltransferase [Steroidobacter sp.]
MNSQLADPHADTTGTTVELLNPQANRAARKYSWREQCRRVLWIVGGYAIRWSPRPCFGWRRAVLRLFGAKIGRDVHLYSSTRVYMPWNVEIGDWVALGEDVFIYSLGKVHIGTGASLAYRAHVCAGTHDFSDPALPLLKPPVVIEDTVWVGTEAFIGPGTTVGKGAIVGARAVVVKDVPPLHIVAGNPARQIGVRRVTEARTS